MDDTALQIVLLNPKVLGNGVHTTLDTQCHVDFDFSCYLFVREFYGNVLLRDYWQHGIMSKSVRIDLSQYMNPQLSCQIINEELRDWPLEDRHRQFVSQFALLTAEYRIRRMPPQHNVLFIPFQVLVLGNRRVFDENLAIELMTQRSMEEADSGMVPATNSSIESLEIKTISSREDIGKSCSICHEEFYSGCEALSMPCSHIFHENCIKRWLQTSHYCPICRFEMPTS